MKVVGIKQLKVRLSEYVRLAKAGETVLERLAGGGEITRAAQPKGGWTWHSRGLGLPSGAAQALLDQLRQERR